MNVAKWAARRQIDALQCCNPAELHSWNNVSRRIPDLANLIFAASLAVSVSLQGSFTVIALNIVTSVFGWWIFMRVIVHMTARIGLFVYLMLLDLALFAAFAHYVPALFETAKPPVSNVMLAAGCAVSFFGILALLALLELGLTEPASARALVLSAVFWASFLFAALVALCASIPAARMAQPGSFACLSLGATVALAAIAACGVVRSQVIKNRCDLRSARRDSWPLVARESAARVCGDAIAELTAALKFHSRILSPSEFESWTGTLENFTVYADRLSSVDDDLVVIDRVTIAARVVFYSFRESQSRDRSLFIDAHTLLADRMAAAILHST